MYDLFTTCIMTCHSNRTEQLILWFKLTAGYTFQKNACFLKPQITRHQKTVGIVIIGEAVVF